MRDRLDELDLGHAVLPRRFREWEVCVATYSNLRKVDESHFSTMLVDGVRQSRAISSRARQLSCAGIGTGCAGMLSP